MSYPLFTRDQDRLSRGFALALSLGGAQVVWTLIAGLLAGGRFAARMNVEWDELIPLERLAIPWFITVAVGASWAVLAIWLAIDHLTPRPPGFLMQCMLIVLVVSLWFGLLSALYPISADPLVPNWHWLAAPIQVVTVVALAITLARELRRERRERERLERERAELLAAMTAQRPRRRWGRR